jgi:hypothetical protein
MRSFKSFFLLLLIFIPATAYVGKDARPSVGLSPGSTAPEIEMNETGKELLGSLRGRYLLLQFWAAYDAESRMNNLLMHNSISRHGAGRVRMVSLDFDTEKSVFDETIRTDGIAPSTQYFVAKGQDSEVYQTYRLSKGYGNYLINPEGVIVAKNVSPDKLEVFIK